MLPRVHRDYRKVIEQALDQGATLIDTGGRHPLRVLAPDGAACTLSTSPTDSRGKRNLDAWLRRHGLEARQRRRSSAAATQRHQGRIEWLEAQPPERRWTKFEMAQELGLSPRGVVEHILLDWQAQGLVRKAGELRKPGITRGQPGWYYAKVEARRELPVTLVPPSRPGPATWSPPQLPQEPVEIPEPVVAMIEPPAAVVAPQAKPELGSWPAVLRLMSEGLLLLASAAEEAQRLMADA